MINKERFMEVRTYILYELQDIQKAYNDINFKQDIKFSFKEVKYSYNYEAEVIVLGEKHNFTLSPQYSIKFIDSILQDIKNYVLI